MSFRKSIEAAALAFFVTPVKHAAIIDITISGMTNPFAGGKRTFDLSTNGTFQNIVVTDGCLEASGSGTGICSPNNTSATLFFDSFGIIQFSPAAVSGVATDDITRSLSWEVSTRAPEPVPLPAGLPLVLTGLAGLAGLRMRAEQNRST